jgi:hypothetical protein
MIVAGDWFEPDILVNDEAGLRQTAVKCSDRNLAVIGRRNASHATTGGADCCARATTGIAAARPSPAMNSRRRISALQRFCASL